MVLSVLHIKDALMNVTMYVMMCDHYPISHMYFFIFKDLLRTYPLHPQEFECPIQRKVTRNVGMLFLLLADYINTSRSV